METAEGSWFKPIKNMTVDVRVGERSEDGATVEEFVEVDVSRTFCGPGRIGGEDVLKVIDVAASEAGPELAGVSIDARGGEASLAMSLTLVGTLTETPASPGCTSADPSGAVVSPLTVPILIQVTWESKDGAVPMEFTGDGCVGACYLNEATARGTIDWAGADVVTLDANAYQGGFFFEDAS